MNRSLLPCKKMADEITTVSNIRKDFGLKFLDLVSGLKDRYNASENF